jgi:hypothetical protein
MFENSIVATAPALLGAKNTSKTTVVKKSPTSFSLFPSHDFARDFLFERFVFRAGKAARLSDAGLARPHSVRFSDSRNVAAISFTTVAAVAENSTIFE